MKIVDFKCPNCRRTDWLYAGRGERHYAKCLACGQIRLLLVRPLPPTRAKSPLADLFPSSDAPIAQVEGEAAHYPQR